MSDLKIKEVPGELDLNELAEDLIVELILNKITKVEEVVKFPKEA